MKLLSAKEGDPCGGFKFLEIT